jgi:hypothetical protein
MITGFDPWVYLEEPRRKSPEYMEETTLDDGKNKGREVYLAIHHYALANSSIDLHGKESHALEPEYS